MSKAKFDYDESGTFFYFLLSFLSLILIPSTYYLWSGATQEADNLGSQCCCNGCINKRKQLSELYKWKRTRHKIVRGAILFGWLLFVALAYKCATIKNEFVNWNPFLELGIEENADAIEIKRAYRNLSLVYHPDKGGDADKFVRISKAYQALSDPVARKNWEEYGHPDGPGATSFGIALPSWIVEKENSFIVLGIYALLFMVALPVSVGIWWYRSVKFGCDKVLLQTSELYYYFIYKTPTMALKRVIMILAASLEFAKTHNPEVVERPTDNQEVPRLIRTLNGLSEKNTEKPLCFPYSIKSRAIIHAHLSRMKLPLTLDQDRCFIVRKCPYLLQEIVQCISQLTTLALAGRVQYMPNLSTLENSMKLCPLIVQALWEYQSPLLQLPHFSEDTLKTLEKRKIKIKTIEGLSRMNDQERRESLKIFNDSQYADICLMISNMPSIKIECRFEVLDDEDPGIITAGSIVTINLKLTRRRLGDVTGKMQESTKEESEIEEEPLIKISEEKQEPNNNNINGTKKSAKVNVQGDSKAGSATDTQSDDEEWDKKFQDRVIKKQKVFQSKSKKSHPVHCPYFPDDKQEFWWVYVVERKRFALVTAPLLVTSLVDTEDLELKFTAPYRPGNYSYTVVVRSDSYVDSTIYRIENIEVKPAKEYVETPYEVEEEEEEEEEVNDEDSAVEDSDLLTDNDS